MKIEQVTQEEGKTLAEIRARAMKPSLKAIGRFDEERVRNRFLETFTTEDTKKIVINAELIGFFVVREKKDHMWLDHLCIEPNRQSQGIGKRIIDGLKKQTTGKNQPVKLCALRGSKSNNFYQANGFDYSHEDEFDIYYKWFHCQ